MVPGGRRRLTTVVGFMAKRGGPSDRCCADLRRVCARGRGGGGIWWTARTARGGTWHLGLTHTETQRGRLWTACGQRCVDSKNSHTTPATTSTSSIRQLLGAADTQTAHPVTQGGGGGGGGGALATPPPLPCGHLPPPPPCAPRRPASSGDVRLGPEHAWAVGPGEQGQRRGRAGEAGNPDRRGRPKHYEDGAGRPAHGGHCRYGGGRCGRGMGGVGMGATRKAAKELLRALAHRAPTSGGGLGVPVRLRPF